MSNTFKIRNHIQSLIIALDNYEYGRVPLERFEGSFEVNIEYIRDAIEVEKRATEAREE